MLVDPPHLPAAHPAADPSRAVPWQSHPRHAPRWHPGLRQRGRPEKPKPESGPRCCPSGARPSRGSLPTPETAAPRGSLSPAGGSGGDPSGAAAGAAGPGPGPGPPSRTGAGPAQPGTCDAAGGECGTGRASCAGAAGRGRGCALGGQGGAAGRLWPGPPVPVQRNCQFCSLSTEPNDQSRFLSHGKWINPVFFPTAARHVANCVFFGDVPELQLS